MKKHKHIVVHVVPSFHYDVAYVKTYRQYLPEALANIKAALSLLETHADYTYSIEQVVLLREYWKRYPQDRAKIRRHVAAGRLYCAPGMFTMPDSNIPSGEGFIRNALIGRAWLKETLGITPGCCWMADIFGHNPQGPQLAKTCGFSSYMFERGKAGSWKTTFNWKGIDGTTIPAHWEVDTYFGLTLGLAWTGSRPQAWIDRRIWEQVLGLQQAGSPCKDVLMTSLGGDFLKPTGTHVAFVRDWNRRHRDIRLVFSSPEAYFEGLSQRKATLPEEQDDLNPLCEGCFSSRIRIKQANRRLEELAGSLETLETLTGSSHRTSEALWETLSLNAFHDILCGSLVRKAAEEALAQYGRAQARAEGRIASLMTGWARKNRPPKVTSGYLLFNSLPYARKEIVQVLDHKHRPIFRSVDLPPVGFATVEAKPEMVRPKSRVRVRAGGRELENEKLKLVFGPSGTIVSLIDKAGGHDLACPERGMNNPIRQSDIGDPWTINGQINSSLLRTGPLASPCPVSGVWFCREGRTSVCGADADCYDWPVPEVLIDDPLQATVQFRYPTLGLTTQVSLRQGEKLVRIKTFFTPQGKRYRLLVAFPTSIQKGRIRHSVPCGHIQRPEGEYAVQGWMDYADREKGLLLVNKGLPGNNVTGGVMMLSLFRAVSLEAHDKRPWYEEGIEQVFEYGIMPFSPGDEGYNPARTAAVFNRELCVLPETGVDESLLTTPPLVELQGEGAELSCLRWEGRGLRLRLRLWESRGRHSRVRCVFGRWITACFQTDAAGTWQAPLPVRGNTVPLKLRPFEITTLNVTV